MLLHAFEVSHALLLTTRGFVDVSQECPVGTYKNETGSDNSLCKPCSMSARPRRATFIYVRGLCTLSFDSMFVDVVYLLAGFDLRLMFFHERPS